MERYHFPKQLANTSRKLAAKRHPTSERLQYLETTDTQRVVSRGCRFLEVCLYVLEIMSDLGRGQGQHGQALASLTPDLECSWGYELKAICDLRTQLEKGNFQSG